MCDHADLIPIEGLTTHPPETVPIVAVAGWRCVDPECGAEIHEEKA